MKNGKVLLVTGGGRGIGAQIALGGAKAGWRVAVNYAVNVEAAATVVEHIEAAGGEALAVKGDVGERMVAGPAVRQGRGPYRSSTSRSGSSKLSLTRTRKVTASLPSTMR